MTTENTTPTTPTAGAPKVPPAAPVTPAAPPKPAEAAAPPATPETPPEGAEEAQGAPERTEEKPSAAEVYRRALEADKRARAERERVKQEAAAHEQRLKSEREALDAERAKLAQEVEEARRLKRLIREDPEAFLDAVDISFDEFRQALASGQKLDPRVAELNEKLARLEDAERQRAEAAEKRAAEEKAEAEKRAADEKRNAAINQFRETISASDAYGLTAHYFEQDTENATGLLVDVATRLHSELGRVPTNEEAAGALERTIMDDTKARLSIPSVRAMALELLRAELNPDPKPVEGDQSDKSNRQPQQATGGEASADGPSTLGNRHSAQPGPRASTRKMGKDAIRRLAEAARKDGLGR